MMPLAVVLVSGRCALRVDEQRLAGLNVLVLVDQEPLHAAEVVDTHRHGRVRSFEAAHGGVRLEFLSHLRKPRQLHKPAIPAHRGPRPRRFAGQLDSPKHTGGAIDHPAKRLAGPLVFVVTVASGQVVRFTVDAHAAIPWLTAIARQAQPSPVTRQRTRLDRYRRETRFPRVVAATAEDALDQLAGEGHVITNVDVAAGG